MNKMKEKNDNPMYIVGAHAKRMSFFRRRANDIKGLRDSNSLAIGIFIAERLDEHFRTMEALGFEFDADKGICHNGHEITEGIFFDYFIKRVDELSGLMDLEPETAPDALGNVCKLKRIEELENFVDTVERLRHSRGYRTNGEDNV